MQKVLYIINPISGVGKQKIIEKTLEKYSDKQNINYQINYTEYAKHAIDICKQNVGNFDAIIIVGGDGSINEVAQSLIHSNTALGIIPTGSGNGFARDLKIPLNIKKAIGVINNFNTKLIDTAQINNEYFVNVAGLGFDAQIAHKFAELGTRGFKSYVKLTLKEFAHIKRNSYKLTIDEKTVDLDAVMLTIANGRQFGNNAYIAPGASMTDGKLNVTIVNIPKIIQKPIKLAEFRKTLDKFKIVRTFSGKKISIQSESEFITQIDGEPSHYKNNIEIEVLPQSLKVIVPMGKTSKIKPSRLLKKIIKR